ncbi:MAG: hypothetical protein COU32_04175 [Candidatus Magasanikbacteria bacterium CG10_big_fil_rev_8_21_14_0_10_42_10]|uniref:Uncharacterized protein n=2 Tax=Candidatus Magasanikiibacteriota TaxID=1752731 RepID=A0A2H0TWY2_9BACT|nr:MAG: hypothetical protein COU32_04175 [Candidatus Magasanikbacteria bacterium CG10_big_fil_rev_8_21_14_0_10_42_10]PIZ93660.1 MAG: hypothetical protein COX82_02205 [Candidatus Magasanikbacteria bacterium CG_4_10_14_0_2_um_filter_41_10]
MPRPSVVFTVELDCAVQFAPSLTIKFPDVSDNPAISASPALYACTFVPITNPKLERADDVLVSSDKLFAASKSPPPGILAHSIPVFVAFKNCPLVPRFKSAKESVELAKRISPTA